MTLPRWFGRKAKKKSEKNNIDMIEENVTLDNSNNQNYVSRKNTIALPEEKNTDTQKEKHADSQQIHSQNKSNLASKQQKSFILGTSHKEDTESGFVNIRDDRNFSNENSYHASPSIYGGRYKLEKYSKILLKNLKVITLEHCSFCTLLY